MAGPVRTIKTNFHIPSILPVNDQKHSSSTEGIRFFCIKLDEIEIAKNEELRKDQYQCQMLLYKVYHQQFIGNIWTGRTKLIEKSKLTIKETIYFYTTVNTKDLLLCLILQTKSNECSEIIAWTALHLVINEKSTELHSRTSLLPGTPLSLLFMSDNLLETFHKVENASLFTLKYSLSAHPLLMRIIHLIPENYLIDSTTSLPGVFQAKKVSAAINPLKKPQLQKCQTLVLTNLTIRLGPSLDAFEAAILKTMTNERVMSETTALEDVAIVQRNLQVGVHNGLCYVQESDSYRLLVEPIITTQTLTKKRSSGSSTSSYTREDSLVVRSDVKIPNVPDDPDVFIVFVVEYTVAIHLQASTAVSGSSLGRTQNSSATLLWGACRLSDIQKQSTLSMRLINEPAFCPNRTLFLKTPDGDFTISCSISSSLRTGFRPSKSESHLLGSKKTSSSVENLQVSDVIDSLQHMLGFNLGQSQRSASHSFLPARTMENVKDKFFQNHAGKDSDSEAMDEVDVLPSSVPLIPPSVQVHPGTYHLPRSVQAKLHMPDFPSIYDQRGQPVTMVDPSLPYPIDLQKEKSKVPEGHKFVFLFLGLTGKSDSLPESLFFTFQFYRFPSVRTESVFLKPVSNSNEMGSSKLCIFYPVGSIDDRPPGYQVVYCVDPSHLNGGEWEVLANSLAAGNMVVDLWNAKSMMYFGTVVVPFKYLCRQGKDSTCVTLELDILNAEFPDDSPGPRIPQCHQGQGRLHFRMASIRTALTSKSLTKLKAKEFYSSSKSQKTSVSQANIVRNANPIIETNQEVAKLLASRNDFASTQDSTHLSEERKHKLARMDAVRRHLGHVDDPVSTTKQMQNFFNERQRDLLIIESYIQKNKANLIHSMLHSSITSTKHINTRLGESYFFEYELNNPSKTSQNIYITWKCPELSLVTSASEWSFLQQQNGTQKKMEKNLISFSNGNSPCIFLEAGDTVIVPFKYHTASLAASNHFGTSFKAASGYLMSSDVLMVAGQNQQIKISFETDQKTLVSVLVLKVQLLPPSCISQSLRFLSPNHSLFQKNLLIKNVKHVSECVCSDQDYITELFPQEYRPGALSTSFQLKGPSGASGSTRTFYLFLYSSENSFRPIQTWKIAVHSMGRMDLNCTAGQMSQSSIVLRGESSSCLVRCFSDSSELVLQPFDAFVLSPFAVQELSLSLCCLLPGVGYFRLSLVAQDLEELLQSWLIVVSSQKPPITKAFQVCLLRGVECVKKITFRNRYSETKQYTVLCSHKHLLQPKEKFFSLEGQKSHALALQFLPQKDVGTETVFLYISDIHGNSEETFCIKVNCE